MHLCYGAADGNSTKAQRGLYGEEYPNRTILCKDILQNNLTIAAYKYIESCKIWQSNSADPDLGDRILHRIQENLRLSISIIAVEEDISNNPLMFCIEREKSTPA